MANINPYAGDTIQFPPGTPASVINQYYAAIIRNQNVEAAQVPWYQQAVHGLTNDVLNPYLQQIINEPFQDYRKEFDTTQAIRQANEVGAGAMGREQEMLRYKDSMENADLGDLGLAAGHFADIANTAGPSTQSTTSMGGGVNPYGEFEDPWSTGSYVPQDQQERAPTSQSVVDESGNVHEEERGPLDETMPADTGKSNIFTTTPGKKPSSADVIAQMAAKYPTIDIGRLLKFLGPQASTNMLDVNKIDAQQADIDRKNAAAEKDRALIGREEALLKGKQGLLESQATKNNASAGQFDASAERVRALAQTEQGRNTIRQYIMDHPELPEEEVQKLLALSSNRQVEETPEQRRAREIAIQNEKNKRPTPTKGTSIRQEEMRELASLNTKKRAGSITPDEENRRMGLIDTYKNDPVLVALMKSMGFDPSSGGQNANAPASGTTSEGGEQGPGKPMGQPPGPNYIWVRNKATKKPGWLPRDRFDANKYTQ